MADRVIHIERKDWNVPGAAETLRAALLEAEVLDVTVAEAVAASGLPLALAQEALLHLSARYPARIRVGEAGTLRFTFGSLTRARGRPRPASLLEAAAAFWGRHAPAIAACALMMLVPPFLLTVAGHAAGLFVAAPAPGSLLAALPAVLLGPLKAVALVVAIPTILAGIATLMHFQLIPLMGLTALWLVLGALFPGLIGDPRAWYWELLSSGFVLVAAMVCAGGSLVGSWLLYRHFVFGEHNLVTQGLWRNVTGVLFGALPEPTGELADERRIVAAIVARDGVLTTADLMATFGWTPDEADERLVRVLADYGGDFVVSDEGAILYVFDAMRLAQAPAGGVDERPCWERAATYAPFWDAPRAFVWTFWILVAVGVVGLARHPLAAWFPPLRLWGSGGLVDSLINLGASAGLGVWPYLFVAAPVLLRVPGWRSGREAHQRRAGLLRALKFAVTGAAGRFVTRVPPLAVRLGGEVDVARTRADGKLWLHFPALARAQRAAAELRAARGGPHAPEAVAYDTGEAG